MTDLIRTLVEWGRAVVFDQRRVLPARDWEAAQWR